MHSVCISCHVLRYVHHKSERTRHTPSVYRCICIPLGPSEGRRCLTGALYIKPCSTVCSPSQTERTRHTPPGYRHICIFHVLSCLVQVKAAAASCGRVDGIVLRTDYTSSDFKWGLKKCPIFTTAPYNNVPTKIPFGAGNTTFKWRSLFDFGGRSPVHEVYAAFTRARRYKLKSRTS